MFRIILATFFFTYILCDPPGIKKCETTIGNITKIEFSGSDFKDGKYSLKRGTTVNFEITLTTTKEVKEINAFALISSMKLDIPLNDLDGCKILKCPLPKGGPYVYKGNFPVLQIYPQMETVATLRLKNEDNEVLACIEFPGKIE